LISTHTTAKAICQRSARRQRIRCNAILTTRDGEHRNEKIGLSCRRFRLCDRKFLCSKKLPLRPIKTTQLIFYTGRNNHLEPSGKRPFEFYEHFISARGACGRQDPKCGILCDCCQSPRTCDGIVCGPRSPWNLRFIVRPKEISHVAIH
jgi:hypothetical protein